MRIFTLGTDHRPEYDFARILVKHGIQVVCDLRRSPDAREEYFRRDGLQALCAAHGIDYVFLGNELGGPQDGDLAAWAKTEKFKRWVDIIRRKLEQRVCCLLCAERSPERCHRRTITDELARQGIEVVHLLNETTFWVPRHPAPNRRVRTSRR
ncbi:MAG: DUF488 domain-containing protein [candidate division WOR-3 bacterium]